MTTISDTPEQIDVSSHPIGTRSIDTCLQSFPGKDRSTYRDIFLSHCIAKAEISKDTHRSVVDCTYL